MNEYLKKYFFLIIVPLLSKGGCDQITRNLRMDGFPALAIHGDKGQSERDWVLSVSVLFLFFLLFANLKFSLFFENKGIPYRKSNSYDCN